MASSPQEYDLAASTTPGLGKQRVEVEQTLSLPHVGSWSLMGVVYAVTGCGGVPRRHLALCKGPDGFFWKFDGLSYSRLTLPVSEVLPSASRLLFYVREQARAAVERLPKARVPAVAVAVPPKRSSQLCGRVDTSAPMDVDSGSPALQGGVFASGRVPVTISPT